MVIRHIEDYYELVQEKYPDFEIWEIDKILKHGFRSLCTIIGCGADVKIQSAHNSFNMYIGKLFTSDIMHNRYCYYKSCIKARMGYKHRKEQYSGYYYFGLREEEYQKYFGNKKGRLKNKVTFDNLTLFKVKEEAELLWEFKHFFKVPMEEEYGFRKVVENFSTRNAIEYARRNDAGKLEEL